MAKSPFEADPDLQAMRGASPMSWGRVVTGILVVGCATFGFAYYLPLQRAHGTLTQRFGELQSQVSSAHRAADEAKARAKELSEKQQALESQADQAKQTEKGRAEASLAVKTALEQKLQKSITKDQAAVAIAGGQAVASLSLGSILSAGKVEVSPAGKATLCSVAGAAGERAIRVVAVADKKAIPATLAAKLKTPLQYNVAVAQVVTEALLDKCNVPGARLSATGLAAEPAAPSKLEGKRLPGARLELWLDGA